MSSLSQHQKQDDFGSAEVTRRFHAQGLTVLERLSEWSVAKADAPCLYYGETGLRLTYGEFNRLCNQAANGYARLGVKQGERISVLSCNALVTTITMFAAWKLGAVYCPINNQYRDELLTYILNDTVPSVLFTDQSFIDELNRIKQGVRMLPQVVVHRPRPGDHDFDAACAAVPDEDFEAISLDALLDAPSVDPDITVSETDLANILYTSGTTGNPKGVVHTHRWMHSCIYLLLTLWQGRPNRITYSDLPLYHVAGACFNVVNAIWSGSQLALWDRFSPNQFWHRIRASGATHAALMDVMIDWLMKAPPSPQDRDHNLLLVSMNPLPAKHHQFSKRFGIDFVGTGYGSTELGAGFFGLIDELDDEPNHHAEHWKDFTKEQFRQAHRQLGGATAVVSGQETIGKGFMGVPNPLVEVEIRDESGQPLGPGVPGQAAFRSILPDTIFRGYFNKPDATREAVKVGWLSPADIIHYDNNGRYYFETRQQGFIRVRGENLSAATVEDLLNKHPDILRSAVVGIPAPEGNEEEIVAFIVKKTDAQLDEESLQPWMRQHLPKFMRPTQVRFLDKFPVTPTFKIKKYKLKQTIMAELKL